MKYILLFVASLFSSLSLFAQVAERDAAYDFNTNLGRGVNFMAGKITNNEHSPFDFELVKKNNFTHIRLGSHLWKYIGAAPDFKIDTVKLKEYRNAIDWALDAGLMVVVNPIHYWRGYTDSDLPTLKKMWSQFANEFSDYPIDKVAFELMNEPDSYDFDLESIIKQNIEIIRSVPGNEKRIVIVAGQSFSTRQALISAFDNNKVFPIDDPFLIGTYHYYDPRKFSKQASKGKLVRWANTGNNDTDWDITATNFDEVVRANNEWAVKNVTLPLPIYCGEYGIDNGAPKADRIRWLWWIKLMNEERGFSHAIWNLYGDKATSKGMGPWTPAERNNPATRSLNQTVLDAYRNRYELESAKLFGNTSVIEKKASSNNQTTLFSGKLGDSLLLNKIYIAKSGSYDLTLRYQNTSSKPAIITIKVLSENNIEVESKTIELSVMNNEWVLGTIPLKFTTGKNNKLVFVTKNRGASFHLDYCAIGKGKLVEHWFNDTEIEFKKNRK